MIMDFLDDFIIFESLFPSTIDVKCGTCGNCFQVNNDFEGTALCNCPSCGQLIEVEAL